MTEHGVGTDAARSASALPAVSPRLLQRRRVLKALDAVQGVDVVCLQAPGGYGKTTAVAQWLEHDPRPVVWLTVRAAAADPEWVGQALLHGLADAGLISERVTLTGSSSTTSWHLITLPLVERMVSEIARPFVVVVDDAGVLTGPAWECLVESIAVALPSGAQLVLTTRDALPATLWRLQTRDQVAVLGPDVLAFDEIETRQVIDSVGVAATAPVVEALLGETEGWPVAVYVAALAMRSPQPDRPSRQAGRGASLTQYLRRDVVGRLPDDDAAFLKRTAVLSSLDADSCDAVASVTGSLGRLRRLSAANHLLAAEDEAGERFRMHPLLAEVLTEQLREEDPAAWRQAHEAASSVDERRGDLDGAVHHAKLAGDDARLGDLVWSHAWTLLGRGQAATLERWLDGLDEGLLMKRGGLALSAAWAATHLGNAGVVSRLVLLAQDSAGADSAYALDASLLGAAMGAKSLGQIEAASRAFIAGKPSTEPWQTVAHYLLGVTLFLRDEPVGSLEALSDGYRLSVALDIPLMEAHCLAGLADAAVADGDTRQALSRIHQARTLTARYRLDTIATTAPIFTTSAVGYVLEGRFADARREAARALRLTALMQGGAPWQAVLGRLALAQVNVALGDPERSRVLLDEATDAHGPASASPRLDRAFAETRERLSAVRSTLAGASSLTTAEVRLLQYLPTHLSFPEIADALVVSKHTVKTQAMSAYRKLGVHSRTEAIERARRAGLLPPR